MMRAAAQALTVMHSHPVWLPLTQTWMYHQVQYLPPRVRSHIACERVENADRFGIGTMHIRGEEWPRWKIAGDRVLQRMRVAAGYRYLASAIHASGANVLHSHFGHIGWSDLPVARWSGTPHVVTFYGQDVSRLPRSARWRRRYRSLFAHVALVLCEGPHMAERIRALGCPASKVRVQHLGVPLETIPYRPRSWNAGEPLRVLIAASFREKKGIPYAVRALGRLSAEQDLAITLIGDAAAEPSSKAEKARILAAVQETGLAARVRMLGFQPYSVLMKEAHEHHVFLAPSVTASDGDTEGGAPVSIIEMVASGMPVVSTTHCDIPNIIRDAETGFLAPERDLDGLEAALRKLLSSPKAWPRLLQRGRSLIEAQFDAARQGERLADIYEELTNGCRVPGRPGTRDAAGATARAG